MRIRALCTAYESGFGHGFAKDITCNPYAVFSDESLAYGLGYEEGWRKLSQVETTAPCKEDAIVRAALESVVKFYRPWREIKWPSYALTCNDALKALDRATVKTSADPS